jgi:hypothetical protein
METTVADLVKTEAGALARPIELTKALGVVLVKAAANWAREFPMGVIREACDDMDPRDFPGGWVRLVRNETYPPVAATFRKYVMQERDERLAREATERAEAARLYRQETDVLRYEWTKAPTRDPLEAAERLKRALTLPMWGSSTALASYSTVVADGEVVRWTCSIDRIYGVDGVARVAPDVQLVVDAPDGYPKRKERESASEGAK